MVAEKDEKMVGSSRRGSSVYLALSHPLSGSGDQVGRPMVALGDDRLQPYAEAGVDGRLIRKKRWITVNSWIDIRSNAPSCSSSGRRTVSKIRLMRLRRRATSDSTSLTDL